jgi:hypothetical protein
MVTAILPSMTGDDRNQPGRRRRSAREAVSPEFRNSMAPSLDSEVSQLTITPERYTQVQPDIYEPQSSGDTGDTATKSSASPPRLAGLVGVFTGCGALVALAVFLPLPAQFSYRKGITQGQAVADSFYVVGSVAFLVALFCFFGLRGLAGEEHKGFRTLLGRPRNTGAPHTLLTPPSTPKFLPYHRLLLDSTRLGFTDAQIGLGYLGGFVARASSVGISLFIPLYINSYFISSGLCTGSPNDPSPELKKECRRAYVLAAELTGISQLIALLCAPLFGYLSDRYRRFNVPLLVASCFGVVGYTAFAQLSSPEPNNADGRGGSPAVFAVVACIGISQIGAIVCSLGLLGRGVLGDEGGYTLSSQLHHESETATLVGNDAVETAPLLAPPEHSQTLHTRRGPEDGRAHLKGSIAGVYSLSGGAAILLLTKLGGYLFDTAATGAPFYMMAGFNAVLLVVGFGSGIYREVKRKSM